MHWTQFRRSNTRTATRIVGKDYHSTVSKELRLAGAGPADGPLSATQVTRTQVQLQPGRIGPGISRRRKSVSTGPIRTVDDVSSSATPFISLCLACRLTDSANEQAENVSFCWGHHTTTIFPKPLCLAVRTTSLPSEILQ